MLARALFPVLVEKRHGAHQLYRVSEILRGDDGHPSDPEGVLGRAAVHRVQTDQERDTAPVIRCL